MTDIDATIARVKAELDRSIGRLPFQWPKVCSVENGDRVTVRRTKKKKAKVETLSQCCMECERLTRERDEAREELRQLHVLMQARLTERDATLERLR